MAQILARPGAEGRDFLRVLDAYSGTSQAGRPPQELLDDYAHFHAFYFAHNDDPERRDRVRQALLAAGIPAAELDAVERHTVETLHAP